MHMAEIVQATDEHFQDIVAIYNCAVKAGGQTGDLEPVDLQGRKSWFSWHDGSRYIIFVAIVKNRVAGYVALSPYRNGRKAFSTTAEISYYLHPDYQGAGIGSRLIDHAISKCHGLGIECLVAILLSCNEASIKILKKYGFSRWGRLPGVGIINATPVDHLYYGRHL